jgi:hypothetical protein
MNQQAKNTISTGRLSMHSAYLAWSAVLLQEVLLRLQHKGIQARALGSRLIARGQRGTCAQKRVCVCGGGGGGLTGLTQGYMGRHGCGGVVMGGDVWGLTHHQGGEGDVQGGGGYGLCQ